MEKTDRHFHVLHLRHVSGLAPACFFVLVSESPVSGGKVLLCVGVEKTERIVGIECREGVIIIVKKRSPRDKYCTKHHDIPVRVGGTKGVSVRTPSNPSYHWQNLLL